MLKKEVLEKREWTFKAGNDKRRIRIYTMNGTQIGLVDVGQGEEALTFPAHWDVQELLDNPHWIRFSTPEEKQQTPAGFTPPWWHVLEKKLIPRRFIYSNGTVAERGMPLGMYSTVVQGQAGGEFEDHEVKVEAKPLMSLDDIGTPPTPPPVSR